MRIIAGKHRGRKLLPPDGDTTRPVTDRVKQSLFDILQPDLPGARVYDVFAGTGSMGLESLSREAQWVTFFEADRSALARLQRNIAAIAGEPNSRIVQGDLFRWFDRQPALPAENRNQLVFLDPPYRFLQDRAAELRQLATILVERHLASNGLVVFRHDANSSLELPALRGVDRREYGSMTIDFLSPAPALE